jgi:hypothetical protein
MARRNTKKWTSQRKRYQEDPKLEETGTKSKKIGKGAHQEGEHGGEH